MPVHSLFPAFVEVFYHSEFGVHVQTLPTNEYAVDTDTFESWSGPGVGSDTMILALIDKYKFLFPSSVSFDSYRIFTLADENSIPLLSKAATITGKVGTASSPGWSKAVQGTLSALGTSGTKARLVFLDSDSAGDFDGVFTLPGSGALFDLMAEWGNVGNAWRTRGNERVVTFLEYSKTLNEKLRREYRMF